MTIKKLNIDDVILQDDIRNTSKKAFNSISPNTYPPPQNIYVRHGLTKDNISAFITLALENKNVNNYTSTASKKITIMR